MAGRDPRILTLDIETSPNLAHVWGIWNQNVAINQIMESGEVICFAAKWYGRPAVEFYSTHHDGKQQMLDHAHRLLSEADVVVHYNGRGFDMPLLRGEFVQAGMAPPAPWQDVDLLLVVKRQFRFVSNKLDFVARQLGLGGKVSHTGHQLWVDCMAGDERAWRLMRKYNRQDVRLTEQLYERLLPWITDHPSLAVLTGSEVPVCQCGSTDVQRRGWSHTRQGRYRRYQCQAEGCGAWFRASRREDGAELRGVS